MDEYSSMNTWISDLNGDNDNNSINSSNSDDDDITFWGIESLSNANGKKKCEKKITKFIDDPSDELNLDCLSLDEIPSNILDFNILLNLDLSRNNISKIEKLPPNLKQLEISDNDILSIDKKCIPDSLVNLNLNNNKISTLDFITPNLKVLNINRNYIESINSSQILNLNTLNIEDNHLKELDLSDSKELVILNISDNILTNIDKLPPQINELELRINCVTEINYLPALLYKFIAHKGKIKKFNLEKFPENLNILDLYDNKLEKCLPLHENLKEVDLMNNNLNEMCIFHDNMKILDIRNNSELKLTKELIDRFEKINQLNRVILYSNGDSESIFENGDMDWFRQLQQYSSNSQSQIEEITSKTQQRKKIDLNKIYVV